MNCHDLFSAGCFYFQNEERPFRGFNIQGFMGRRLSYSSYRFEMERHSLIHLKFKRKNPSIVGRISSKSQSFLARGQDGASHVKPFPPLPPPRQPLPAVHVAILQLGRATALEGLHVAILARRSGGSKTRRIIPQCLMEKKTIQLGL